MKESRIEIKRHYNENTVIRHHEGILTKANQDEVIFDIYAPNTWEASKDMNNYVEVNFKPSRVEKIMQKIAIKEIEC